MPFKPGQRKPPGSGRQKAVKNKKTLEFREQMRAMTDNPAYRTNIVKRMARGKLAPQVEVMFWHYAYGKPREDIALELRGPDVSRLSDADLRARLDAAMSAITARVIEPLRLPAGEGAEGETDDAA